MIVGAHSIIYSRDPEADRAFFGDVLNLSSVDAGGGWLIFGLPPAEVAFHPSSENDVHEFYLICDDVEALTERMKELGVPFSDVQEQTWGLLTHVALPGGGKLGIYEPRHARPKAAAAAKRAVKKRKAKAVKKRAAKPAGKKRAGKAAKKRKKR